MILPNFLKNDSMSLVDKSKGRLFAKTVRLSLCFNGFKKSLSIDLIEHPPLK